jgi:putative ABC transport system permease protein
MTYVTGFLAGMAIMAEIIRNMFRRKTRTILTVLGITIGIFAFVVMGSMAEKINLLVNGGTKYYADKVTVAQASSSFTSTPTPMNSNTGNKIASVPGVRAVSASVYLPLNGNGTAVNLGPPPAIIGSDFKGTKFETFKITYSAGRALREGDSGKVVVGTDLVKKLNAHVGSDITVRGKKFEVVGIIGKTLTAPDNEVWMTLPDAQKLAYSSMPEIIKSQLDPYQIVNGFTVYVKPGVNPDKLAKDINSSVVDVKASGPKDFQTQVANTTGIFNAILLAVALISLLVGGLSIINTMTMSITERTKEIGIKKAVGAHTKDIMREYLSEAALIGLIGGILGWVIGAITVLLVNHTMSNSGNIIFNLSLRITVFAIVFSIILGALSGIYPAYHASKVNIVRALREV